MSIEVSFASSIRSADTIHGYIVVEFPTDILVNLVRKMAEIEHRLSTGANENIQLTALISAFQYAKELYPPETASD